MGFEGGGGAGGDVDAVEVAEDADRVVGTWRWGVSVGGEERAKKGREVEGKRHTTKTNVKLRNLVTSFTSRVRDGRSNSKHDIPQRRVSTRGTTSRVDRLSRPVLRVRGQPVCLAVAWVAGGSLKVGRVDVGVDEVLQLDEAGWENC